ncbi:MAG TPA: DUF2961 domain-containing protein [Candidatus Kapabacteria bacterium]|nr:DUF2961 domain-containing protein [Candidatus Kapabacteria bacterium]
MNPAKLCRFVSFLTFLFVIVSKLHAQSEGPYHFLLDPLSLTQLDTASIHPQICRTGHGQQADTDPDGLSILAQDSGAGIITHFWGTIGESDSLTVMHIWIDGVLIRSGTFGEIFREASGMFTPPLDSISSGGYVCDLQLPYRQSFRISYRSPQGNVFYAISWRELPESEIESSAASPSQTLLNAATASNSILETRQWPLYTSAGISDTMLLLSPSASVDVWNLHGPSIIRSFGIKPLDWSEPWDSVWLQVFWNESDSAAISTPLSDFFGQGAGFVPINALLLSSDLSNGFHITLPMPFQFGARIMLLNKATRPVHLSSSINLQDTSLDWNTIGYLHAFFQETNPTRYGVYHPILHWKGAGRYIGLNLSMPGIAYGCALEGDPIFHIDSMPSHSFEYTGTEDYFNGGWYFSDGEFSLAFAGCTQKWFSFYRFQLLDAVDFTHSLDIDLQHGNNNDVKKDYRTVAYFYAAMPKFWTSLDTVVRGDFVDLHGASYSPNTSLDINLNGNSIAQTITDSAGKFFIRVGIDGHVPAGQYSLSIGSDTIALYVLKSQLIRIFSDSASPLFTGGDSLSVIGWGFHAQPSFMIGSKTVSSSIAIDDLGRLHGRISVPFLTNGSYPLIASYQAKPVDCPDSVKITSRVWEEAEDLIVDSAFGGVVSTMNLCPWWNARWSHQEVLAFNPDSLSEAGFIAHMSVLSSHTYSLIVHGTVGQDFGNYTLTIDEKNSVLLQGYSSSDQLPRPAIEGTTSISLDSGIHTLQFIYSGKDSKATNGEIWLDALELEPEAAQVIPSSNPFDSSWLSVMEDKGSNKLIIELRGSNAILTNVTIFDILGRTIDFQSPLMKNQFEIPVKNYPSGVYFVRGETPTKTYVAQIVIAH